MLANQGLRAVGQVGLLHKAAMSTAAFKAGPGGRCSVSGSTVTVFGATGFLGRYVCNRLGKIGTQTVVPFRGDEHHYRHLRVCGDLGQFHFMPYQLLDKESVSRAMQYSDAVINLVGLDENTRHFNLDDVHSVGARIIAEAAAEHGISRLIHVSALGADANSESEFLASKARGEAAVLEAFPEATIIRPGRIFGFEDRFTNVLAALNNSPTGQLMFDGGEAVIRPVYSLDVADAIDECLHTPATASKVVEVFGPKEYTWKELTSFINYAIRKKDKTLNVPSNIAKVVAGITDKMWVQFFVSKEDVIRATLPDVYDPSALTLADLKLKPTELEKVGLNWLRRFRSPSFHDELDL